MTLVLDIWKVGTGPLLIIEVLKPPIFIIGGAVIVLDIEVDLIIPGILNPPYLIIGGALIVLVIVVDLIIDVPPHPFPVHFAE